MKKKISLSKIKKAILSMGGKLAEAEAIGIFGSIVRGDFNERSDIDVFVVIKDDVEGMDVDRLWWDRINEALEEFRRDVTVVVYTLKGLKKIITWYVLRLACEGVLVYDKEGAVGELFKKIRKVANKAGLVEKRIGTHRIWTAPKLKLGERLILEVKD